MFLILKKYIYKSCLSKNNAAAMELDVAFSQLKCSIDLTCSNVLLSHDDFICK